MKMSNGHQLIAEVHQASLLVGPVHIVFPNSPEVERMVIMMNKNLPAYVGHILKDQGLPDSYLLELVKRLCCPVMVAEINQCHWDPDSGTLTTKQDAETAKNKEDLEKASWFKDAFADLGIAAKGGALKKQAPPPETIFDLDEDRSIKTIHHRNKEQPNNVGSITPKKGKEKDVIDVSSEEESDGESTSPPGKQERPGAAATVGGDKPPTSSDEVDGKASGAAYGG
jgi:hypothetical protein